MLKAGGRTIITWVYRVVLSVWRSERVPEDWRKAVIVPLHKKNDQSICENWRGISLLSVAGKVFTNILLTRLVSITDSKISENQAGFRRERGCSDQIFVLRRLMEIGKARNVCNTCALLTLKQRTIQWTELDSSKLSESMVLR